MGDRLGTLDAVGFLPFFFDFSFQDFFLLFSPILQDFQSFATKMVEKSCENTRQNLAKAKTRDKLHAKS